MPDDTMPPSEQHDSKPKASNIPPSAAAGDDDDLEAEQMTCDVLCSLMSSTHRPNCESPSSKMSTASSEPKRKSSKACPKQLQLPMFLSKTYHMIDQCDSEIADWSENGDNFVVKNVDSFASNVLPLYFKHSNFSSFARQLNFYGFRKLRTDPILTSDVDPQTSSYVRFYHEKFQKGKPELLHDIKRATKSDQQSKDEVDSLKSEVAKLREQLRATSNEYDRRLAELSYDFNRRLSATNAEFDKLAAMVQHLLATSGNMSALPAAAVSQAPAQQQVPNLLHSLSQIAAVSLQNQQLRQSMDPSTNSSQGGLKRGATEDKNGEEPPESRARRS